MKIEYYTLAFFDSTHISKKIYVKTISGASGVTFIHDGSLVQVQLVQEHSWFMLEELVELTVQLQEELGAENFVYQTILTTSWDWRTLSEYIYNIHGAKYEFGSNPNSITMYQLETLCCMFAMFLPEPQLSWFLLSIYI